MPQEPEKPALQRKSRRVRASVLDRFTEISPKAQDGCPLPKCRARTAISKRNVWNLDMKVSIGQAAKKLGVWRETLRRWDSTGKLPCSRTPKGHRRYDLAQLHGIMPRTPPSVSQRITLAYARVSGPEGRSQLARQVAMLESFCFANGWTYEVIEDLGSGVNCRKRGLRQLIRRICQGDVGRLVVTLQDRLLRFGSAGFRSVRTIWNRSGTRQRCR